MSNVVIVVLFIWGAIGVLVVFTISVTDSIIWVGIMVCFLWGVRKCSKSFIWFGLVMVVIGVLCFLGGGILRCHWFILIFLVACSWCWRLLR